MTQVRKTGAPVSDIPVQGFGMQSEYASKGAFRDETVEEREQFERENGYEPNFCDAEFLFNDNRGTCTRPEGHFISGASGMHLAGDGKKIVGAW